MASSVKRPDPTPQELVITLLGAYVRPREGRSVWAGGLVALLAELGFSEGAARIALTRLVGRGLLARTKNGRQAQYTLTRRALAVLAEGDRRIFSLGREERADRDWTVLWHAIPDSSRKAREALVRRLRFLGFGSIQDGTWIAARDAEREVSALLTELGVREHAGLLLARPAGIGDVHAFVARAWDLDALEDAYTAFVAEFGSASARDDSAAFALRTGLVHSFRQFPFVDPELPARLVPAPARRADAVQLFHDQYRALEPAAQRHFDEVTQ